MSIEDIILDRDRRGISQLRSHMAPDFCGQAASYVLDRPGTAIIVNGFYILAAGAPETDGPLGAVVIGDALSALGFDVVHVTDKHAAPLMSGLRGDSSRVVDFPIADAAASEAYAKDLLRDVDPSIVIAIERCGFTHDGVYRNMHGQDISEFNAKIDYLFTNHPHTVAIGDGGNEIGMGNLAEHVTSVETLVKVPCVTEVSRLIITSVSNWGGYGLVASMSMLSGKNLLPSVEDEQKLLKQAVDIGSVDGMSAQFEYKVDGFTMEENSETVQALHDYLTQEGIAS